mmetsp:Transcript_45431/g.144982  ORF Transcript_45431/g.144982 Transcript_45431/m.144982 type:complete len:132 (-) Transcript_45431:186-581(-)
MLCGWSSLPILQTSMWAWEVVLRTTHSEQCNAVAVESEPRELAMRNANELRTRMPTLERQQSDKVATPGWPKARSSEWQILPRAAASVRGLPMRAGASRQRWQSRSHGVFQHEHSGPLNAVLDRARDTAIV